MQRYSSNNGVTRWLRCDQAQTFRTKKFQLFCNTNHFKLPFAPVDEFYILKHTWAENQTLPNKPGNY